MYCEPCANARPEGVGMRGAGSVISRDVAPGALAIERSPQKEVPGYAERRKDRAQEDGT